MKFCLCGKNIEKGKRCPTCITLEWRKKNPEKYKAIEQRYYKKHKKEIITRAEKWNKEHPKKHKQSNKKSHDKWVEQNREYWNEYQRNYKRRKSKQ